MSGLHTGCKQGTRIKLLFKDGPPPLITKFKEKKARYIHTEHGKIPIIELRAFMIHKPQIQGDGEN